MGKLYLGSGIVVLLAVAYWIAALHLPLPGREILVEWYGQPTGRLGHLGIKAMALGGIGLIGLGMREMGLLVHED